MANVLQAYDLNGSYVLNGVRGTQTGQVFYCNDCAIFGRISDDNKNPMKPHPVIEKLFLGLHFPERDALAFMKLAPASASQWPVVWIMQSEQGAVGHRLSGNYQGHWVLAGDIPFRDRLEELVEQENSGLGNISGSDLRALYFPDEILTQVKGHALLYGQTGELTFNAKLVPSQHN